MILGHDCVADAGQQHHADEKRNHGLARHLDGLSSRLCGRVQGELGCGETELRRMLRRSYADESHETQSRVAYRPGPRFSRVSLGKLPKPVLNANDTVSCSKKPFEMRVFVTSYLWNKADAIQVGLRHGLSPTADL